jgi:hypothetical protein
MFDRLSYERFGKPNPQRNGFNSIKRKKSQRYLAVKPLEELTNTEPDFDTFNKIEFQGENEDDHHLEYHDMFSSVQEEKVFENNMKLQIEELPIPPPPVNLDVNHEILKYKAMTSFLQNINIQKSKKMSQKYSRNN